MGGEFWSLKQRLCLRPPSPDQTESCRVHNLAGPLGVAEGLAVPL